MVYRREEPVNPNVDCTCIARHCIGLSHYRDFVHTKQCIISFRDDFLPFPFPWKMTRGRHLQCERCGDVSNICRQKVALLAGRLMVMVVVVMMELMLLLLLLLLLLRLMLLLVRMVLKGRLGGGRVARRHQIIRLIEQLRLCLRRRASGRE